MVDAKCLSKLFLKCKSKKYRKDAGLIRYLCDNMPKRPHLKPCTSIASSQCGQGLPCLVRYIIHCLVKLYILLIHVISLMPECYFQSHGLIPSNDHTLSSSSIAWAPAVLSAPLQSLLFYHLLTRSPIVFPPCASILFPLTAIKWYTTIKSIAETPRPFERFVNVVSEIMTRARDGYVEGVEVGECEWAGPSRCCRRDVFQFAGNSVSIFDQILFYLSAVCSGLWGYWRL